MVNVWVVGSSHFYSVEGVGVGVGAPFNNNF